MPPNVQGVNDKATLRGSWEHYLDWSGGVYAAPTTALARVAGGSVLRATGHEPDTLTEPLADIWWVALRGKSKQTKASYLGRLRSFYSWRHARTGQPDPTRHLKAPKVDAGKPRPCPLPIAEAAISGSQQPTRTYLALATYAGLRRGEIAGLRPDHITRDLDGRPILSITGKGSRRREVPLLPALAQLLAAYPWPDTTPAGVGASASRALRRHGWNDGVHSLRHTFAMHLLQTSGRVEVTQAALGHSSIATTQVYARANLDDLHAGFGGMFGG